MYLFVGNCVILVLRPTPPSFMGREVLSNGIYFHIYHLYYMRFPAKVKHRTENLQLCSETDVLSGKVGQY